MHSLCQVSNTQRRVTWGDEKYPIPVDYFLPGFVPILRFRVLGAMIGTPTLETSKRRNGTGLRAIRRSK